MPMLCRKHMHLERIYKNTEIKESKKDGSLCEEASVFFICNTQKESQIF